MNSLLNNFRTAKSKQERKVAMEALGFGLANACYNRDTPIYFKPSEKKVLSVFESLHDKQEWFITSRAEAACILAFLKELDNTAKGNARADWFYSNINILKNVDAAILATRIINGNIGEGCGRAIAIDTFGNTFKEFAVSKATAIDKNQLPDLKFEQGMIAQEKLDGFRCNIFVDVDSVMYKAVKAVAKTANGNIFELSEPSLALVLDYCNKEYLAKHIFAITGCNRFVLDCEAIAKDGLFSSTASIMQSKHVDTTALNFKIFDVFITRRADFHIDDEHDWRMSLSWRVATLTLGVNNENFQTLPSVFLPKRGKLAIEAVLTMYENVVSEGGEGLMLKYETAYFKAKRTRDTFKLKIKDTKDLVIVEVTNGTGKYDGKIGALIVENNGRRVHVGTGLNDEFRGMDPKDLTGRIIEVEFMEETTDGSLRMPRFKRFRDTDQKPGVKY